MKSWLSIALAGLALGGCSNGNSPSAPETPVTTESPETAAPLKTEQRGAGLDVAAVKALAGDARLAKATSLDLSQNPIGDDGAGALAASAHTGALNQVWLGGTGLGDAGLVALSKSGALRPKMLFLGSNGFAEAGLSALLQSPVAGGLNLLRLSMTAIGDGGARALAAHAPAGLTDLEVAMCGLTDAGVRALFESAALSKLETLDIGGNEVGDETLALLADAGRLPALKTLTFLGRALDPALAAKLKAARPGLTLTGVR